MKERRGDGQKHCEHVFDLPHVTLVRLGILFVDVECMHEKEEVGRHRLRFWNGSDGEQHRNHGDAHDNERKIRRVDCFEPRIVWYESYDVDENKDATDDTF